MAVTVEQFKASKPQFALVENALVQIYLDMAGRVVDGSWDAKDMDDGQIAFACHLMTMDGLGNDSASRQWAKGMGEMQTIKSADLTLVRFQRSAGEGTEYVNWLAKTACGQFYGMLLRMNRAGPRIVTLNDGAARVSGYAKDAGNRYGWPGVFNA